MSRGTPEGVHRSATTPHGALQQDLKRVTKHAVRTYLVAWAAFPDAKLSNSLTAGTRNISHLPFLLCCAQATPTCSGHPRSLSHCRLRTPSTRPGTVLPSVTLPFWHFRDFRTFVIHYQRLRPRQMVVRGTPALLTLTCRVHGRLTVLPFAADALLHVVLDHGSRGFASRPAHLVMT